MNKNTEEKKHKISLNVGDTYWQSFWILSTFHHIKNCGNKYNKDHIQYFIRKIYFSSCKIRLSNNSIGCVYNLDT